MITVLLADDHAAVRGSIRLTVESCSDMKVLGEAATGEQVLQMSLELEPDVILLDYSMPGPGFKTVIERLKADCPKTAVLVLSFHPEDQMASWVIKAGAAGYMSKDRVPKELVDAIRRLCSSAEKM